jgi:polyisoprenoid-binding protein YceI
VTIIGVTHQIVGRTTTRINRKDFGLTWNVALETSGILVGDEVTVTLDVQFVKA